MKDSKQTPSCNIYFQTTLHSCPNPICEVKNSSTCYCTMDQDCIGSFDAVKGRLSKAILKSKYIPLRELSDLVLRYNNMNNMTSTTNTMQQPFAFILWHLHVGDIVLNNNKEYFWTIATQIAEAFKNSNSMIAPIIVFAIQGGELAATKYFPFISDICNKLFSHSNITNCFYPEMDVRDTFYHMIHSNVLVTTESSFPAVAAAFRSTGITLAGIPKEGVVGIYETSEQLRVNEDGTIQKIGLLMEYLNQL